MTFRFGSTSKAKLDTVNPKLAEVAEAALALSDIDFGITSHVLVIGKTSQSRNNETGELRPVSINVSGLVVLDKRGNPNTTQDSGETYTGWF